MAPTSSRRVNGYTKGELIYRSVCGVVTMCAVYSSETQVTNTLVDALLVLALRAPHSFIVLINSEVAE